MELFHIVIWPATVLVIVLVVLLGFRNELRRLFTRMAVARLPGGTELTFGNSKVDRPVEKLAPTTAEEKVHVDWTKHANLFWLAHDLMWSIDVILRGGEKSKILHGLVQSKHHASELGLAVSARRLGKLHNYVVALRDEDVTVEEREKIGLELRRITDQLGAIAEAAQPLFHGRPLAGA